jgi:hypothetical protein
MPGIVKIGKTTRDPSQRAYELHQTGVPMPFVVEASIETPNCDHLEKLAHRGFASYRVSDDREFFRISPYDVIKKLESHVYNQVCELIDCYTPDYTLVRDDVLVCPSQLYHLHQRTGILPEDFINVLDCLEFEDLHRAVALNEERVRLRAQRIDAGIGLGSLDPDQIEKEIAEKLSQDGGGTIQ